MWVNWTMWRPLLLHKRLKSALITYIYPPLVALWKEIAGLNPLCWNCCKKAQYSKCIPLLSCQYSSQISCISSHFLYWIATILYWNFIDKCQIPVEQSLAKQSARVLLYIAEICTGCILKNKKNDPISRELSCRLNHVTDLQTAVRFICKFSLKNHFSVISGGWDIF